MHATILIFREPYKIIKNSYTYQQILLMQCT